DGSEERLAEGGERTQELHCRMRGTQGGPGEKILQIIACAEGCTLTAQQHGPHRAVRLCGTESARELLVHEKGDGVALLGTIEAHLAHPGIARHENRFAHAASLRQRLRACNFTAVSSGAPDPRRWSPRAGGLRVWRVAPPQPPPPRPGGSLRRRL